MTDISQIANTSMQWLGDQGPMSDIVISSRVRLARNVAGYSFFIQSG